MHNINDYKAVIIPLIWFYEVRQSISIGYFDQFNLNKAGFKSVPI
jgi:hypothetical protein